MDQSKGEAHLQDPTQACGVWQSPSTRSGMQSQGRIWGTWKKGSSDEQSKQTKTKESTNDLSFKTAYLSATTKSP